MPKIGLPLILQNLKRWEETVKGCCSTWTIVTGNYIFQKVFGRTSTSLEIDLVTKPDDL